MAVEWVEPKTCPFCGNTPKIVTIHRDGFRDKYTVMCRYDDFGCGAEGGVYHSVAEALEAWNARDFKPVDELLKQIAVVKKAVKAENSDYLIGYISALSAVEGMIADMRGEQNDNPET